jgi:hypothetical protein
LKSLALLRVDLVDTLYPDNKGKLWLCWNVERAILFGDTGKADLLAFCVAVLLDVGLSALEDDLALLFVGLVEGMSVQIVVDHEAYNVHSGYISPERWLTNDSIGLWPSRKCGSYHQQSLLMLS